MTMKEFNNLLLGIEDEGLCFNFAKDKLMNTWNVTLFKDLISLPCMEYRQKDKVSLLLSLIKDEQASDFVVQTLVNELSEITVKTWGECKDTLKAVMEEKLHTLSKQQQLGLAHAIEVMFAKGLPHANEILAELYMRVEVNDGYIIDDEENVRIRLAKIAYTTNIYNVVEKENEIKSIKNRLKKADREFLMGMVNYYRGICVRCHNADDGKDTEYYMLKARSRGFYLASVYLNYKQIHFETSRTERKWLS